MKKFELIDHTADLGIIAYGENIKEAFSNVAYAMFSQIIDLEKIKLNEEKQIEIEAEDLESLLVTFLNELLYHCELEKIVFKEFKITHLGDNYLKARCFGEKIDIKKSNIEKEIKSATYHLLKIEHNDIWKVQVLFDV